MYILVFLQDTQHCMHRTRNIYYVSMLALDKLFLLIPVCLVLRALVGWWWWCRHHLCTEIWNNRGEAEWRCGRVPGRVEGGGGCCEMVPLHCLQIFRCCILSSHQLSRAAPCHEYYLPPRNKPSRWSHHWPMPVTSAVQSISTHLSWIEFSSVGSKVVTIWMYTQVCSKLVATELSKTPCI